MCPYELRQSIRCPKKYGESTKRRTFTPGHSLEDPFQQRETDPQKPLEDRYIRNAAVIPDLGPPCGGGSDDGAEATPGAPLLIHGFTVPQYQQVYRSVVGPLLPCPRGKPAAYSLELGRVIKERLFGEVACPLLQDSEKSDGRVEVTERFCVLRPAPHIDVD